LLLVLINTIILLRSILDHIVWTTILIATLNLAASLAMLPLSYLEDERNFRPSSLLVFYLIVSVLDDGTKLWDTTIWMSSRFSIVKSILLVCIKLALCGLESQSKETCFIQQHQDISPEAYKGLINRTFFWWLNDLLFTAVNRRISLDDVYGLDEELKSKPLNLRAERCWEARSKFSNIQPLYLLLMVISSDKMT